METIESLNPEMLKKKREESHTEAFSRFALQVGTLSNHLFCFYENKDNDYYYLRIINHFHGDHQPIKCGNKNKVIKTHNLIKQHSEYDKYKKAYFVDKDFDESIKGIYEPPIYETPCYSIENLYCTISVISEVLKNKFDLIENSDEYRESLDLYEKLLNDYLDSILLFNAWYSCFKDLWNKREKGSKDNLKSVSLEAKIPKQFVTISLSGIVSTYDHADIKNMYPETIEVPEEKLKFKIDEFKTCDKLMTFRGKYILEFLYQYLIQLNQQFKKLEGKIKFHIEKNSILSQFSIYANAPDCLIKYIEGFN